MCKILEIPRSLVYYQPKTKSINAELDNLIIKIFKSSRNNYGSRKIKVELFKLGYKISRRKIRKIMDDYSLVSNYTIKQFKKHKSKCNESDTPNIVDRKFNDRKPLEVIISDLTYVRILNRWCYVCLIVDLFNREIVGYSAGKHHDANLVKKAFLTIKYNLEDVDIFHSDRGKEFDNILIEEVLSMFNIARSLSNKGTPYDNAVAEATYKIFKTEFCLNKKFDSLEQLKLELFDYVNWYNNLRIHGSLDYLTPMEYKAVHI
jgi:transposase InsO family protein